MKFCFDANAFIQPWHNRYPIDLFPDFWDHLEQLGQDDHTVFTTDEVLGELERVDDELLAWVKARPDLILPLDENVQLAVTRILKAYPRLINARKQRSMADPFVIAHAQVLHAAVVTEEQPSSRPRDNPRITDVCQALDTECIDVLTFMRQTGLKFGRR